MTKIEPINSPSLWTGDQLADCEELFINFNESHLSEINYLISGNIDSAPNLNHVLKDVRNRLEDGKGVVIIKNIPVSDFSFEEAKSFFLNLVSMIGTPVSQSSEGELIFSVKDSGYADDDPRSRGPNTVSYTHLTLPTNREV